LNAVVTTLVRAVSPKGNADWAKVRRALDVRRFLDFRRVGLCACCCAGLATTARAQQTAPPVEPQHQSPAQAEPPVTPPPTSSEFVPEVLPIGSDVEASTSGWRSVLASVNKDIEGPALRAGSVVSGGGFALGGHWRETISTRARLDTEYMVSVKGYQSALIDLSSQPLANGRLTFGFGMKYESLPMEDFFGLGQASEVGTHTSYERQGLDTRGWARIRVRPWFELRPSVGHLDTRLLAGEQSGIPSIEAVDWRQPVSGVGRQSRYMHAGLAAIIDRRDDAKRTRSGILIKASAERFEPVTDQDGGFLKTEVDVRGYLPIHLFSRQDVFAVRGVALLTDGTRHQSAPFYFLPRLGGGGLLRGYETSRFVDTQALFASAEYRWQAHRRLQVVSFVDVGQVAPSMRAFELSNVQTSVGVGIRYRGFRIDYAKGAEGGRLHVGVGASF
jgi:hypothetical protein